MIASFVLIITDSDARTFCVEGPIQDDTAWTEAVVRAQEGSRRVNCHVPGIRDVEGAAESFGRAYPTLKRVLAGSIVTRPVTPIHVRRA